MSFNDPHFIVNALLRLLLAAALGAIVGLERETKHKPAGLRTIMLITFGSALFTVLSEALTSVHGGDPQRIAAQLIPGVGFLGAGAIIRAGANVIGLTTAATIFVMASVGMAAGGGLMLLAIVATVLLIIFLGPIGWAERRYEVKLEEISLSATVRSGEAFVAALHELAHQEHFTMKDFHIRQADGACDVEFTVDLPAGREEAVVKRLHEIQNAHE